VIGLNPPFGKNGRLAKMFLAKAVEFQPKCIALISPATVPVPDGYQILHEDFSLFTDK